MLLLIVLLLHSENVFNELYLSFFSLLFMANKTN